MSKPMMPHELNVENLSYSPVKTMASGAKIIFVNNGSAMAPICIQSPEMNIPFDSGTFWPSDDKSGKYAIQAAMDGLESNKHMKAFHDMLDQMDKKIVKDAMDNCTAWFKKPKLSEETANDLYTSMVKVSKDPETGEPNGKWAPKFSFKINKRDGKTGCKCYDKDRNLLVVDGEGEDVVNLTDMLKKGSKVKMILKCNGLWIASGKFGCTWRAEQIRINTPMGFDDYAFRDDDGEDSGVELTRQSGAPSSTTDTYVSDSESDSGEEAEEETKVVKRKVKKSQNQETN